jgi:hypothetical protein
MARHAVVDLCAVFRLEPARPRVERLPPSEEGRLASYLAPLDVRLRADEASVTAFAELVARYEPYVQALSSFMIMPMPAWVPPEGAREGAHRIQ